ncbi:uncharacterized protein RCH25_053348 [Pelodytes ibericus]
MGDNGRVSPSEGRNMRALILLLHIPLLWCCPQENSPDLLEDRKSGSDIAEVKLGEWLSPQERSEVQQLLREKQESFSNVPGYTPLATPRVETSGQLPMRQTPYRIPEAVREHMRQEINEMLQLGVIEPSDSPWASPVVLVLKRDGTTRFCMYYRRLNEKTVSDAYPMPRIDELLDRMARGQYLTTIDLCNAVWDEATFQRMVDCLLDGFQDYTCAYLDDIDIFSNTWQEHLTHIGAVIDRLREAGLTLKPAKCSIGMAEVQYLGHRVGCGMQKPEPAKVEAVAQWPTPRTKTQVLAFLGTAGYYRKFVPNYSALTKHLTNLTRKNLPRQVTWTPECEQAFQQLKNALVNAPVLAAPDPTKRGDSPLIPKVDFPGGDILKVPAPDDNACRMVCTQHPYCQFFSFHSRGEAGRTYDCYLKTSDSGSPTDQVPKPDVTSGYSLPKTTESVSRCLPSVYDDVEFVGSVLSFGLVGSQEECQLACTRNPGCQFYTYYPAPADNDTEQHCYLQYSTSLPSPTNITESPGAQSGFSQKNCCTGQSCSLGCSDLVFPDLLFSGSVISSSKVYDAVVCQQQCNQTPGCQFFTYSLHESSWCECYLKRTDSGLPNNITFITSQYSGFKDQASEPGFFGCADLLVPDAEFEGVTVIEEEVQSVQECQQRCTNYALCQFFTFLPRDLTMGSKKNVCYLKNAPGNIPTKISPLATAVSGFSMEYNSMKKGEQNCTLLLYPDLVFSGTEVARIMAEDAESCHVMCSQNPDCKYFTFYSGTWSILQNRYTCQMKSSSTGTPDSITRAFNTTSGFAAGLMSSVTCSSLFMPDSTFTGSLLGIMKAPDAAYCQRLCTQNPLCHFFTYFSADWTLDDRRFSCFLQRDEVSLPNAINHLPNATAGFSKSLFGLERECVTEQYRGLNFPGSEERSLNTKSYDECNSLCTADPTCQFFTYFNQTYLTPDQTNTCYLKSLLVIPLPQLLRYSPGVKSGFPQRNCEGRIPGEKNLVTSSKITLFVIHHTDRSDSTAGTS